MNKLSTRKPLEYKILEALSEFDTIIVDSGKNIIIETLTPINYKPIYFEIMVDNDTFDYRIYKSYKAFDNGIKSFNTFNELIDSIKTTIYNHEGLIKGVAVLNPEIIIQKHLNRLPSEIIKQHCSVLGCPEHEFDEWEDAGVQELGGGRKMKWRTCPECGSSNLFP